jgi:hypothetical protein
MTMRLLGRLSPNRKLRLMIFLVSGLPLVLAGLVFIAYEATGDYSETLHELTQKAAHIAKHVGGPMEADDVLAVKRELALWSIHEDVLAAAIYDADGKLIARYVSPGADVPPTLERPRPGVRFEGTQVTDVVPILLDGRRVGTVSLSASLTRGYQHVASIMFVGAGHGGGLRLGVPAGAPVRAPHRDAHSAVRRRGQGGVSRGRLFGAGHEG